MKWFAFITALFVLANGTKILVTPMGDEGACGDEQPREIHDPTFVYSPNFGPGQTYPSNSDCSWHFHIIGGDPDDNVKLDIIDFSVEECRDCHCDYLEAFDGPNANSQSLGKRCGGSTPSEIGSSGSHLFLRFVSDESIEFRGFSLSFSIAALPPPACIPGNDPEIITQPNGFLTSPGYPGPYDPNLFCRWILSAPGAAGYYIDFDPGFATENCCTCDYLELWLGTDLITGPRWGRWYGDDEPNRIIIVGAEHKVLFRSDFSISAPGFRFQFTAFYDLDEVNTDVKKIRA